MSYREVLFQAYSITIRNPIMWLFGLVILGGYNLFLINFFSIIPESDWKTWPLIPEAFLGSPIVGFAAMFGAAVSVFIVLNLIKLIFIVVAHGFLHRHSELECDLCVRLKRQTEEKYEPLPYFAWLIKVLIASAVTIGVTLGITLTLNAILASQGGESVVAVIINLLFIAAVACIVGTWNVFTGFSVVLHGLSFAAASSAAIDLMVKHARRVLEFVVLLSAVYTLAVLVGSAFIHVWHNGFLGEANAFIRAIFLVAFIVWFAINNAFFNLAFLIFFDKTVKATPAKSESRTPLVAEG